MTAELPECLHAGTTTLGWLYGEADDGHAAHIAACPSCTAAVDAHERALGALVAAREVVAVVGPLGGPAPSPQPVLALERSDRSRWRAAAPWGGIAAVAAIAAVALFVIVPRATVAPEQPDPIADLSTFAADDALLDLHDEIDALEATLASL